MSPDLWTGPEMLPGWPGKNPEPYVVILHDLVTYGICLDNLGYTA